MKIKLYLYHEQWVALADEPRIAAYSFKFVEEKHGARIRIFLGERDVEVPDIAPLTAMEVKDIMLNGLREQRDNVQAAAHTQVKQIDDQIQQLLCLENKLFIERE